MYRVSPFTYLVSAILSVALANAPVECSSIELLHFDLIPGTTCGSYMNSYISASGGYLTNPDNTADCDYCLITFLKAVDSIYNERWRNFGIMWVYVVINVAGALFLYRLIRVPKKSKKGQVQNEVVIQATPTVSITDASETDVGERIFKVNETHE
jgi:ABC-type multidrug transport system permease subunit